MDHHSKGAQSGSPANEIDERPHFPSYGAGRHLFLVVPGYGRHDDGGPAGIQTENAKYFCPNQGAGAPCAAGSRQPNREDLSSVGSV